MNFEKEISSEMLYDIAKNTNLLEQYLQENSNRNSHLNLTMINIERECLLQIKRQEAQQRTLNVSILIYHRAHWAMDTVYKELVKSGFDVKIIITPAMEIEESLREQA
jgi:hypothetical protein